MEELLSEQITPDVIERAPVCKFCGQSVDPNGMRVIINHEYAHIDCRDESWNRSLKAHQELERIQRESEASMKAMLFALDKIFRP